MVGLASIFALPKRKKLSFKRAENPTETLATHYNVNHLITSASGNFLIRSRETAHKDIDVVWSLAYE